MNIKLRFICNINSAKPNILIKYLNFKGELWKPEMWSVFGQAVRTNNDLKVSMVWLTDVPSPETCHCI